jgi:hypothetical protein
LCVAITLCTGSEVDLEGGLTDLDGLSGREDANQHDEEGEFAGRGLGGSNTALLSGSRIAVSFTAVIQQLQRYGPVSCVFVLAAAALCNTSVHYSQCFVR